MHASNLSRCFNDKWSVLALMRFALASIVAITHLSDFGPLGVWAFIPMFGAFEAIAGFLVISGYSIGASYQKESKGFIWRRARRIYPVYLASMVIVCVSAVLLGGKWPGFWEVVVNVLFLNQIVTSTSLVGPAWSLSLEFWLYCLTPLLFGLSDKTIVRLIAASFVAFCVYTCGRTLFHWDFYAGVGYGLNLPFLAFIWLAGLRLARRPDATVPVLKMIGLLFSLHILLTATIQFGFRLKNGKLPLFFSGDVWGLLMQAATLAVVVYLFARVLRPDVERTPSHVMRWLGDISFPLYLVHYPIFTLLDSTGFKSPVLYFLTAIAAAAVLYRTVDFYSQQRPVVVDAPVAGKRSFAFGRSGGASVPVPVPVRVNEPTNGSRNSVDRN
jgi:peptidoglycan/LPS O-acetylase OafA/YrhL